MDKLQVLYLIANTALVLIPLFFVVKSVVKKNNKKGKKEPSKITFWGVIILICAVVSFGSGLKISDNQAREMKELKDTISVIHGDQSAIRGELIKSNEKLAWIKDTLQKHNIFLNDTTRVLAIKTTTTNVKFSPLVENHGKIGRAFFNNIKQTYNGKNITQ